MRKLLLVLILSAIFPFVSSAQIDREMMRSVKVHFRQGATVLDEEFMDNKATLSEFAREVKNVEKGKYSKGARRECLKAAQEVLEGQTKVTYKGRKLSMKKYHFFNGRLSSPKLRIGGHAFK